MAHRDRLLAAAGPLAAAVVGGPATDPGSGRFRRLDKPVWYPPPEAFGIVWTGLYAALGLAAGEALAHGRSGRRAFARAYCAYLSLNAAWPQLLFRAHRPWAAALTAYAAWTAFATALTVAIARRNPRRKP